MMSRIYLTAPCWRWAALALALALSVPTSAHDGSEWNDAREIEALAININRAAQTCGLHTTEKDPKRRAAQSELTARGLHFQDSPPPNLSKLASAWGRARYHRWADPHAEIWLLASMDDPACVVAVSNSQWVSSIGPALSQRIQIGHIWRPARDDENPLVQADRSANTVYTMDLSDQARVRPILIVTTPAPNKVLIDDQQLLITVTSVKK